MGKSKKSRPPSEPLRFYRTSVQRLEEAEFLLKRGGYATAAVYLAGYAIECALKALILWNEPTSRHQSTIDSFRGARAHEFEWLKKEIGRRNFALPPAISRHLANLAWWGTDLRYNPKIVKRQVAEDFLARTNEILLWAKGRLGRG